MMDGLVARTIMAALLLAPALTWSTTADARYGRRAAFVGGVAAGAVVGGAARAARYNYYYGGPQGYYYGAPGYSRSPCGYDPYPPCY
jgi:hypothetical protein